MEWQGNQRADHLANKATTKPHIFQDISPSQREDYLIYKKINQSQQKHTNNKSYTSIPAEKGMRKQIEQKYDQATKLKWEEVSKFRNKEVIDIHISYDIMKKTHMEDKRKDLFTRLTNTGLKGKAEMRKKMLRYDNMTPEKKDYFLKKIYDTYNCEFEENTNITDDTNHILMECTTNKQIRKDMYKEIQAYIDEQLAPQQKTININDMMNINSTDTKAQKTQKIMLSRGLTTIELRNKIQDITKKETTTKNICQNIQQLILKGTQRMYTKRNRDFFNLKKQQKLYNYKHHNRGRTNNINHQDIDIPHLIGIENLKKKIQTLRSASRNDAQLLKRITTATRTLPAESPIT